MLTPHQMSSVIITGPNNIQETIIKELHKIKVIHIVEHSKNDLADIGKPLENANILSEILVKVRALIATLHIKKDEEEFELNGGISRIDSEVERLIQELSNISEELKKTEEHISKNESLKQELEILKDIDVPLESFASYKSLIYFMGFVKDENRIELLKESMPKITKNFMLFSSVARKRSFIVLFVDAKNKENASKILRNASFNPISFVSIINLKGSASSNLKKIEGEIIKLEKKREEIKKGIDNIAHDCKGFLFAAEEFLVEELEKAEAPLKFAATQSSFLIKGWIPKDELRNTIERLNKVSKNKIFIHFEPAKKEDKVPVKLKNPKYAMPFEFFIELYTMPTYQELDPTFFVFLTFPMLFGMMLGDIGYGIVSFMLFWILKRKMPNAKNFFNVMLLASFVTILFGLLFGEFFGSEEIFGFELWHILSRAHGISALMYIAIGVGVLHVNIGILIGFFNELKSHGIMDAVYAKVSWIILQIGIALLALAYFVKIPILPLIGAAFLATSILMLYKGEGIKGIIELPSIFTNILSYARLMAIGLSSVILAVIINESSAEFFHKGGFFILVGVFILILGHTINLLLGLLGSFLHSLRLHYVEFFTKFFHGGAKKYHPFGT